MPTYRLTIEYEGTRYSGWQAQGNTPKTIQGHLMRAASQVAGDVDVGGAGRTDAGVHAAGQVAHLRLKKAIDPQLLVRKINDLLPHDICVLRAARAGDGFHARHDAVSRVYLYQIATRRTAFAKSFVWWIKDRLDANAIRDAAARLVGRHDFSAFTDKRLQEDESRVVVVGRSDVAVADDLILFRIEASHFLWTLDRMLIEDVDFTRAIPLRFVARKSLAVNLSDLAAMGALPAYALVALGLPPWTHEHIDELLEALASAARQYDIDLVGGDLSRAEKLTIAITAVGYVEHRPLLRSGARAGDRVYLSRPIGGPAAGLWLLQHGWSVDGGPDV